LSSDSHPPRLDPIENRRVLVGEKLSILVSGKDPDGDALTFKIAGRPERAQFIAGEDGKTALFTWIPEVQDAGSGERDYTIEFFVVDDGGDWDSQEVVVTVLSQGAAAFLNPPGYVLDLAHDSSIEFLVQVKDDSASQVAISLTSGPEGSYIEQTGKKTAYFFWRPGPAQIAEKLFWYIRLKAVGLASDPARPGHQTQLYELSHDIAIVITNADYAGCPGSAPVIEHEVLADQHPTGKQAGYQVKAAVLENESFVERVSLFWTTGNPEDESSFQLTSMSSQDGATFSGAIPQLAAGAGKFAHYYLEAWDNDDYAGSTCDHVARAPKQGFFSFVAYDPEFPSQCLDDPYEENDSLASVHDLEGTGSWFMLRLCGNDEDYFGFTVLAPEVEVTVLAQGNGEHLATQALDSSGNAISPEETGSFSASFPGGVLVLRFRSVSGEPVTYSVTVSARDDECVTDALEPNDSSSKASQVGKGGASFQELTLCAGDVDWYRLEVPGSTLLGVVLEHSAQQGDLDLHVLAADGLTVVASAETSSDNEKVQINVVSAGTYFLRVTGFQGSTNSYNLSVSFTPLAEGCQEDSLAPNQYPDEAVMLPPGDYKQLVACPGKEDWFAIGLNGGEELTVEAVTTDKSLTLKVVDGYGNSMCTGTPKAGKVAVSCNIPAPANYGFVVSNESQTMAVYDLAVAVFEDTSVCKDDRFEENDMPQSGAELQTSTTTWLKLCGADVDWFHFTGYPMEHVLVGLLYDPADGPADVWLYDELGSSPVGWSDGKDGAPVLEFEVPELGTYQVLVKSLEGAGANVPYSLFVWFQ